MALPQGPAALELYDRLTIEPTVATALVGPPGRGKPWLAVQVARAAGLAPVVVDARDLNTDGTLSLTRSLWRRTAVACVVVNYLDAAEAPVLGALEEISTSVHVVACGTGLPAAARPAAWSRVAAGTEWQAEFTASGAPRQTARSQRPAPAPDHGID